MQQPGTIAYSSKKCLKKEKKKKIKIFIFTIVNYQNLIYLFCFILYFFLWSYFWHEPVCQVPALNITFVIFNIFKH